MSSKSRSSAVGESLEGGEEVLLQLQANRRGTTATSTRADGIAIVTDRRVLFLRARRVSILGIGARAVLPARLPGVTMSIPLNVVELQAKWSSVVLQAGDDKELLKFDSKKAAASFIEVAQEAQRRGSPGS